MKKTFLAVLAVLAVLPFALIHAGEFTWEPLGLGGGGAMFTPAISPVDPKVMMINCDMSGAYISQDGGRTWSMIHYAQLGGNTRCRPAFHPKTRNTIFAASGWWGHLKVSHDAGKTWAKIGNLGGRLFGEIAIDPGNPKLMLAGTIKSGIWRSTDGARTWAAVEGPTGRLIAFHFDQTSPAGKRVCFAATDKGVWRSDDGGQTWQDKSKGLPWPVILSFSGGSNRKTVMLYCSIEGRKVYNAYQGGIYKSSDRGETWTWAMGKDINKDVRKFDKWGNGPVAQYRHVFTCNSDPTTMYALNTSTGFNPPRHNTVYRSDDAGQTWRATLYSDPRFKKFNVEYNWRTANIKQDYPSVGLWAAICATDPNVLMKVDTGMCLITDNGGTTWYNGISREVVPGKLEEEARFRNTGLVVTTTWHYYVDPFDTLRHYIAYTDIGFARSLDAGKTWNWWGDENNRWVPWKNTCYELVFDPEVKGKVWGAFSNVHDIPNSNIISGRHRSHGPGGVAISVNHGANWQVSNKGLPEAPVTSLVMDPKSPKNRRTLYAGIWESGVYRSTDDGKTWTGRGNAPGSLKNKRIYRIILHRDGTLFALVTAKKQGRTFLEGGAGIYRSGDKGKSWKQINRLLWPKDMTVDPDNSKIIYVGAADAWKKKQGGLYRTLDGGKTWKKLARKGTEHFGAYLDPWRKGWIYMTLTEGAYQGGLWLSKDNGKTWALLDDLPFMNVQRVAFDPKDKTVIYATTFGGSVWKGRLKTGL